MRSKMRQRRTAQTAKCLSRVRFDRCRSLSASAYLRHRYSLFGAVPPGSLRAVWACWEGFPPLFLNFGVKQKLLNRLGAESLRSNLQLSK